MVFRRRQQAPEQQPEFTLPIGQAEFLSPSGGLSRRVKNLLRFTLAGIVAVSATDVVLMSRSFGAPADPLDDRTDVPTPIPVLSARRVPDILGEIGGAPTIIARVNELFGNERMGKAAASSCVLIRKDGRAIVSVGADLPVIPASTMKLITATAALDRLGPETVFTTRVLAGASPAGEVLTGNLQLVGGGDPLLATADYLATFEQQPQPATSLEALADAVAGLGIKRITGDVVGDDRLFDAQRSIPSWKDSYRTNGEVGPLSALSVNDGFARTAASKRKNAKIVFKGTEDPAASAAATFATLLTERGITVEGASRSAAADEQAGAQQLASLSSLSVREIVAEMLTQSDNTTAELLLKSISVATGTTPGTTAAGLNAVKAVLTERRIDPAALTLIDGSGLDRANKVTCAALVQAVEAAPDELRESLPVAGETGTLIERMLGDAVRGKVRAKTGTLNGVSALAGDISTRGGGSVEFAMVLNDLPAGVLGIATGDELAVAIAGYPIYIPTQPSTVPTSPTPTNVAGAEPGPGTQPSTSAPDTSRSTDGVVTQSPTTRRADTRPRPLDVEAIAPPPVNRSLLPGQE